MIYKLWYLQDCDQATVTSTRENTAVTAGETIAITCSITCAMPQLPALTLYKSSSTIEEIRTSASGLPISVTFLKEDNGVGFYCDADDWSGDVTSRELTFDVQCKLCRNVHAKLLLSCNSAKTVTLLLHEILKH